MRSYEKAVHAAMFVLVCLMIPVASFAGDIDFVRHVNTFIGTVAEGNAFPGTTMPFGMVQASPDTGVAGQRCAGFDLRDGSIRCFSQTHANGTGRPALGDGALMPFVGETDGIDFSSPYDKSTVTASPDLFACRLTRYGIGVEVTASKRVGWYRLTYPQDASAKILVDTAATISQPCNLKKGPPVKVCRTSFSDDRREIRVYRRLSIWEESTLCFAYRFSKPWTKIAEHAVDRFLGEGARYALDFGMLDSPLEVQVAVSSVSAEGAAANLAAETFGRTFDSVRAANRAARNELLGRLTIDTDSDEQKVNWYTALYHLCIQPNLYSDVDGRYTADDGSVKQAPNGTMYTMFSLWDTFRAAHPLYTLLVPDRVQAFLDSIWRQGKDHGHLPMWVMWGRETHTMIGMPSIPVLVDAWTKGWRVAKPQELLDEMIHTLTACDEECPKNSFGLIFDYGYIPHTPGPFGEHVVPYASVSRNLEIAYAWWCVARFARMIGNEPTARHADSFAGIWKKLYDPETGFMRARADPTSGDGAWRTPFDPLANRQGDEPFWGDYTEANAYVYTWHVFQDVDGLVGLMGGRAAALKNLDRFFGTRPKPGKGAVGNNDEGGVVGPGQIGQYWQGNEPSHHVVYLYSIFGRPDRAAELVRRICTDCYRPTPDGLCGNDDCGQMSAWYLFSAMGFYPLNPCGGEYVIGAPQVPKVTLNLANGKTFTMIAKGFSKENKYVKSVTLNGKPITDWKIRHEDIMKGGELVFEMIAR